MAEQLEVLSCPSVVRKDIPCGVIHYQDAQGVQHAAEFVANVPCGNYDDTDQADLRSMACDEYNEQYMVVVDQLMNRNCKFVSFQGYRVPFMG